MNTGKTVYAQVLEHLPRYEFNKCVKRYNGKRRVRKFSCYDQFLCLAFAQVTYRESLRDIETCLNSHQKPSPIFTRALAGGTLFSMDQTTPTHQNLLRYITQCRQNPDLDRYQHLPFGRHHEKKVRFAWQPPHNSANSGGQHF